MATVTEKKLAYLQGTKDAIKAALIEKGQTVSDTDTFRSYAEKAGIASVIRQPKFVELKFAEEDLVYVDEAMARRVVSQYPLFANYRASTPPAIILKPQKNFINEMLRLMSQLRRCIKAAHKV